MVGAFTPDLPLSGQGAASVAELMRTARPVLLDLAGRPDLRASASGWQHRLDIQAARTGRPPAGTLLIRPDGYIAWAAAADEPASTAIPALREALSRWLGAPENEGTG
jgi:hypothetical protein